VVWFKVDDSLAGHNKPRKAGLEAMGLWGVAGSWSAAQLQDGRVAGWYVDTWPKGRALAAKLVRAVLWHAPGHDCRDCPQIDDGWIFHDWEQANPLAAHVRAERDAAKERMRLARERKRSPNVRPNDSGTNAEQLPNDRTNFGVGSPSPTRPDRREGGSVVQGGAVRDVTREAATPPPDDQRPDARCAEHRLTLDPPPCGACGRAREAAEAYDAAAERRAVEAAVAERHRQAELRAEDIRRCGLCDDDGRLESGSVCGHDPDQIERNRRHIAEVREQLANRERDAS
jgi:hypothetical protein